MTTYTPVLPEFDPVLQPIGYALAHEFLGGIVVEEESAEAVAAAPVEDAPAVAEEPEIDEIQEIQAEETVAADAGATVELLIPVPTSLHGSPIDWFAPTAADDEDEDGDTADFVVRRAS